MAINPNIDNGGEDQFAEQGGLDGMHPAFEQHNEVMREMLPEDPPAPDPEEIKAGHDAVLDEMAGPPLSAKPLPPPAKPAEPKRGRYQVPKSQRTPENRAERREKAQASKIESGRLEAPAEAPTLQEFFDSGGEVPDFGKEGSSDPLGNYLEANYRLNEALTHTVIDLTRRTMELLEALERGRL